MMETLPIIEAAKRAGKSERTLRNWLRAGHVEAVRDADGKRVVVVASLDAYLATLGNVPATLPEQTAGLPELVAELGKLREMVERRDEQIRDLEWRNGSLTSELERERQQRQRLEAGPVVLAIPATVPETLPEGQPEAMPVPETWWSRLWRRLGGGSDA